MAVRFQMRRGTAAAWTAANPVLADGELGYEKDTGKAKLGNGVDTWSALPYFGPEDWSDLVGAANGIASLDADGKVPAAQLPAGGGGGSGDMTAAVYDTDGDGKVNAAVAADSVPWTGVSGKPGSFTPSAHSHEIADVTGLSDALAEAGGSLPFEAKGDLFAGTGPGTSAILGLGANGKILMADSTQANGIKWADAPSSAPITFSDGWVAIAAATVLDATAYGRAHLVSGAAAYTITLPAPDVGKSIFLTISPAATALFTLAPAGTDTIDGSATARKLWAGESIQLVCDSATNWVVVARKVVPMFAKATTSGNVVVALNTITLINFGTLQVSNVPVAMGLHNTGTYRYTALRTGLYKIQVMVTNNATNASASDTIIYYRVNGAAITTATQIFRDKLTATSTITLNGATLLQLNAGDYVDIHFHFLTGSYTTSTWGNGSYFMIEEIITSAL